MVANAPVSFDPDASEFAPIRADLARLFILHKAELGMAVCSGEEIIAQTNDICGALMVTATHAVANWRRAVATAAPVVWRRRRAAVRRSACGEARRVSYAASLSLINRRVNAKTDLTLSSSNSSHRAWLLMCVTWRQWCSLIGQSA